MKITLITACLNSQETIQLSFNSVLNQTYKNIEHIIVDGDSDDSTKALISAYPFKNKRVFVKKGLGLYGSLNFGVQEATGKYIIMLHSDDILNNENVVSDVVKILKNKDCSMLFGSVAFFGNKTKELKRFYPSTDFQLSHLTKGLMPPHTGSIIRTDVYKKFLFNTSYKIAGDYDFFIRSLYLKKIDFMITNKIISRMKIGGISGKNLNSYIVSTIEIYKALVKNNITDSSFIKIFFRFKYKLKQILFLNVDEINKTLSQKIHKYYKTALKYDFIVYKNVNKIINKKKFIFSAMNLAFLGSYVNNNKLKFPYLYNWPDGISAKLLNFDSTKIPGREILKKLKLSKKIKRIIVLGNLSTLEHNKLAVKFKKKIINYKLPYTNAKQMFKILKYIPQKTDLIFITLPTPKQEELALEMGKKYKYYKIICIGGSISIWSGKEIPVPKKYINFEFIWRLRYETNRRIVRLVKTFFYVFLDYILFQKISKLKVLYKN